MKTVLRNIIDEAVDKEFPGLNKNEFTFTTDATTNPEHGDYSTNAAMQLTKLLKKNPKELAQALVKRIESQNHDIINKIEIAGPGFINFTIKIEAFQEWLGKLLKNSDILKSNIGKGKKAMVEFVSANPTGPLHIGHGRGAATGDSIAAVLEAVGYEVSREYYVNDAGNQMDKLSKSIFYRYKELLCVDPGEFPTDGYKGDYIIDIAKILQKEYGGKLLEDDKKALMACRYTGVQTILNEIDETLRRFNVRMDKYFSELSLYEEEKIPETMEELKEHNAVYEKDGAIWLATKAKGDEEDRVIKKSDGTYTYLMPDIAYHDNKYKRGFDLMIDVLGADHHGYVKRMQAALDYLGHDVSKYDAVLVQMVGLVKGGEKVTMSTRAGEFITLDWLIDEVGVDAARYFYNMRSANSQFEFDVDLAKSRSNDNPVYYVQYAHARVSSLIATAETKGIKVEIGNNLELLQLDTEKAMIKKMMEFPTMLEIAASYNEPHRVAYYLQDLAADFHAYYYNITILDIHDHKMSSARLSLCKGIAAAIKTGLALLGVSAPERM